MYFANIEVFLVKFSFKIVYMFFWEIGFYFKTNYARKQTEWYICCFAFKHISNGCYSIKMYTCNYIFYNYYRGGKHVENICTDVFFFAQKNKVEVKLRKHILYNIKKWKHTEKLYTVHRELWGSFFLLWHNRSATENNLGVWECCIFFNTYINASNCHLKFELE